MRRLLPPTLFYICVILMVCLNWLFPIKKIAAFPYSLAGVVPLVIGITISIYGSNKFKKAGTNIKTFNEPDKLITDGLYRYSRNPMYLGFALALLGVFFLTGTVSSLIILIAFIIITDRWYIAFEENILTKKFGLDYEEYKAETRKWI